MNRSTLFLHLPPVAWAATIFFSSAIPSNRLPPVAVFGFDKLVHFGIYFAFCWLIHRSLRTQTGFPWLSAYSLPVSIILSVVYGISDEIHQSFVPGRDPSIYDVVANAVGGVFYAVLSMRGGQRKRRETRRTSQEVRR